MSDRDSLAGFSEAAAPDDASLEAMSFAARPRAARRLPRPVTAPQGLAFHARRRDDEPGASTAGLRASQRLEFTIRPPPRAVPVPAPAVPLDDTDLGLEPPPSSHGDAEFDTALLRERINQRASRGSESPSNAVSDSGASVALTGLTRLIDQPSDSSASPPAVRPGARPGAKRQRLAGLPEDGGEDGQSAVSGMFGRAEYAAGPQPRRIDDEPGNSARNNFGNDFDNDFDAGNDAGSSAASNPGNGATAGFGRSSDGPGDVPSRIHSDRADSESFNGMHGTSDDTDSQAADSQAAAAADERASGYVRPRPRDPAEPEQPVVFEVPVSLMPAIDWLEVALDAEGQVLEQRLEHSESESESDESMGSVAEMIDSDSDTEAASDGNADWKPAEHDASARMGTGDSDSDSDTADSFTAATVSESGDSDFTPEVELQVAEIGSRRERPQRHRIPTVKWWLGERIQYEVNGPLDTLTSVDVRRVKPEKKVYRRRRPYRRRRGPLLPPDDDEAEAGVRAVHAPVLDADGGRFRERTVARSINGLEFEPMHYADGSVMPLVSRCPIFGGTASAPVQLYVLRIQPGAVYTYEADANKVCTFVVWRGRCTAKMNRTDFDLQKGMACIVPPANDLYVDNDSNTERGARGLGEDVFFFATEINARDSPELAAAMTRDAQSVVSGAATLSRLFELDRNDDLDEGARSFVSGLHQFSQHDQRAARAVGDELSQADTGDSAGPLLDDATPYDDVPQYDDAPQYDDGRTATMPGQARDHTSVGDVDDAASVAPSIFRDLQDAQYERRQRPPAQPSQFLSFQLGRSERPRPVSQDAQKAGPASDETAPSFHLERGSRLHGRSVLTGGSQSHPRSQLQPQPQSQPQSELRSQAQLRRSRPQRAGETRQPAPTGRYGDDDELADFFAQVDRELGKPSSEPQFESRRGPARPPPGAQAPTQLMLERVARMGRPRPSDTYTQSSD